MCKDKKFQFYVLSLESKDFFWSRNMKDIVDYVSSLQYAVVHILWWINKSIVFDQDW